MDWMKGETKFLIRMLIKFTHYKKAECDLFLETFVFACNTYDNESSLHTPLELMFGTRAVIPCIL